MDASNINHAGLPVAGYRPQSQANVDRVNDNKRAEELLLRCMDDMKADHSVDQRWLSIARTHIEEGFMAWNRSIFRPARFDPAANGVEQKPLL